MVDCGRFHFTRYCVEDRLTGKGQGFEVEDCDSHSDVWHKAFRILSGPFVQSWRCLRDYNIQMVSNLRGLKDIVVCHSDFSMKVYNPQGSSRHEVVFCSDRDVHWEHLIEYFFDQIGVNVLIEEGDIRQEVNGRIFRT